MFTCSRTSGIGRFSKSVEEYILPFKKRGRFRLVLPDLEYSIKKYIDDPADDAAFTFMKETSLGHESRNRGIKGVIFSLLGNSQHLWMWDYNSMESELRNAGFVEIRRARFGDSADPLFGEVEDRGRWDNCLGVECVK